MTGDSLVLWHHVAMESSDLRKEYPMEMIPKVVQAVAGQNFSVYIYFHDGTVRMLDAFPFVRKGGVFTPLQDADFFRNRLTVMNDTVAWDVDGNRDPSTCIDLDPCELYDSCPIVEDPLKEVI
jgi:hypothetical protein